MSISLTNQCFFMFQASFNLSIFLQPKKNTNERQSALDDYLQHFHGINASVSDPQPCPRVALIAALSLNFFSRFPSVPSFLAGHVDP